MQEVASSWVLRTLITNRLGFYMIHKERWWKLRAIQIEPYRRNKVAKNKEIASEEWVLHCRLEETRATKECTYHNHTDEEIKGKIKIISSEL